MTRRIVLTIVLTIGCCATVISFAAGQSNRNARTIDLGVVNGKAITLGLPAYPTAARAAGVHGIVEVRVLINRVGKVAKATAVSGPKLLRNGAARAAKGSTFPSNIIDCEECRYFTGVLVYKFNPVPRKP